MKAQLRYLCTVTVVVLAFGLAMTACAPAATPTPTPIAETPAAATPTPTLAPAERDVVTFWVEELTYGGKEAFEPLVEQYNASQNRVRVEMELIPPGPQGTGLQDKLGATLAAAMPADVVWLSMGVLGQAGRIDSPLIVDLAPYVTPEMEEDYGPILDTYLFRGKLYGFPGAVRVGFAPFIGNKQMLEDARVDYRAIQKNGWTWDQFVDYLSRLKKVDATGNVTVWPLTVEGTQWHLGMMFMNFARCNCIGANHSGNPMFGNKFNYGGPKMVEALQFCHDLIYEYELIPREALGMNIDQMFQMFIDGRTAFYMTEPGLVDPITDHNRKVESGELEGEIIDIDVVLLPVPHNPPCKTTADSRPAGVMVFRQEPYKGDEHTNNAIDFAKFLVSTEAMVSRYHTFGLAPATRSGMEALPELAEDEYAQGFYAILELGSTPNPPNHLNWFHLLWDFIYPEAQAVMADVKTAQEAVDYWTEVCTADMEEWVASNPDLVTIFQEVPPVSEWPGPLFECDRGLPENYEACTFPAE